MSDVFGERHFSPALPFPARPGNPVITTDFLRAYGLQLWQKRTDVEKLQDKCCIALGIS
jgi:hypothetical protein